MLKIKEASSFDYLRNIATYFDADLVESYGAAVMRLNNERGAGYISTYNIIPGLTVRVFNIKFAEDFRIKLDMSAEKPIYFTYNLQGHFLHRLVDSEKFETIKSSTNLVILSDPSITSDTIFPGGIKLEISTIILNKERLVDLNSNHVRQLENTIYELFEKINSKGPLRHLGTISPDIVEYAKIIARNQRTDVIGRLMTEGAVMNMLFRQVKGFEQDTSSRIKQPYLQVSQEELKKCTRVGEYVQKHIQRRVGIRELVSQFDISAKKLQSGIQYLFGMSVNKYLLNIRLAFAKDLLQSTDMTIAEICKHCGFSSPSYFSKTFMNRYDFLPKHYRKSFRNTNALFEICYCSIAGSEMNLKEVRRIIANSRRNNTRNNITGCLIYHNKMFFQIIEGRKKEIEDLYDKITEDSRHHSLKLIWKGAKFVRNFNLWSMALITDQGNLEVSYKARENREQINLSDLLDNIRNSTEISEMIWKKIRILLHESSTAVPRI